MNIKKSNSPFCNSNRFICAVNDKDEFIMVFSKPNLDNLYEYINKELVKRMSKLSSEDMRFYGPSNEQCLRDEIKLEMVDDMEFWRMLDNHHFKGKDLSRNMLTSKLSDEVTNILNYKKEVSNMSTKSPKIKMIVATGFNNAIGRGGKLLLNIPKDLRRFRELTSGNVVVMGRKTFESLPNGALPNRLNIVLSNNANYEAPGCIVQTYDKFVENLKFNAKYNHEYWVLGGGEIYNLFLRDNLIDEIYQTMIIHKFSDADAFVHEWQYDTDDNGNDIWMLAHKSEEMKYENFKYRYLTWKRR